MFNKLLIANRGEIACRIARSARQLGVSPIAVYSDADRNARHVDECDRAFYIGEAAAAQSYLCIDKILDAAQTAGVDAIHPGYGFLAENAQFADLCMARGFVFIGPSSAAIRAMGDKDAAKIKMRDAGVAVVPGIEGEQDSRALLLAAERIGFPLMIKAVCGGGGKGMRIVHAIDKFAAALAAVKRESRAAFADERVLLEKYLPGARHVEVQVFADRHGNAMHLFERDCSTQRRHQKIIEEAPAPGVDNALREQLGAAAIAAARAIDYVGAGTVEFLLARDMQFYFLEMNTRLQVEHPVTEMISGVDLVQWQLQIAANAPLPRAQLTNLRIDGHAIQARIYAENPARDFLPATGRVSLYRPSPLPKVNVTNSTHSTNAQVRIDSGIRTGDEIGAHYDPLLVKLIAHGATRDIARRRLRDALRAFDIAGVSTNLDFLTALLELPDFIEARIDTDIIARNRERLTGRRASSLHIASAALFELGLIEHCAPSDSAVSACQNDSPWTPPAPWRLNLPADSHCMFIEGAIEDDDELRFTVRSIRGLQYGLFDGDWIPIALRQIDDVHYRFTCGAQIHNATIARVGRGIYLNLDGIRALLTPPKVVDEDDATTPSNVGLRAPMPGRVIEVAVHANQTVAGGDALMTIEAMKMQHTICAPHDGIVAQLFFAAGDQVREGEALLELCVIDEVRGDVRGSASAGDNVNDNASDNVTDNVTGNVASDSDSDSNSDSASDSANTNASDNATNTTTNRKN